MTVELNIKQAPHRAQAAILPRELDTLPSPQPRLHLDKLESVEPAAQAVSITGLRAQWQALQHGRVFELEFRGSESTKEESSD